MFLGCVQSSGFKKKRVLSYQLLNKVPYSFQGSVVSLITCDGSKSTHCECGSVVLVRTCCGNASSLERVVDVTIHFLIIHLFQSLQFSEM